MAISCLCTNRSTVPSEEKSGKGGGGAAGEVTTTQVRSQQVH